MAAERGIVAACDNGVRIPRAHLEEGVLAEVREQLLSDRTIQWAEKEVAKRLAAPAVDASGTRRKLAEVEAELRPGCGRHCQGRLESRP